MIRPIWPVFRQAGWPAGRAEAGLRICRTPGASADAAAGSWPAALVAGRSPLHSQLALVAALSQARAQAARLAVVRAAAGAAVMVAAGAGLRGVIAVLFSGFGKGDRAFWGVRVGGQRWQVAVMRAAVDCAFVAAVQGVYLRARANGCGLQT